MTCNVMLFGQCGCALNILQGASPLATKKTSDLIYYLGKNDFIVSITSFKSSLIQHDVYLVNDGPI